MWMIKKKLDLVKNKNLFFKINKKFHSLNMSLINILIINHNSFKVIKDIVSFKEFFTIGLVYMPVFFFSLIFILLIFLTFTLESIFAIIVEINNGEN